MHGRGEKTFVHLRHRGGFHSRPFPFLPPEMRGRELVAEERRESLYAVLLSSRVAASPRVLRHSLHFTGLVSFGEKKVDSESRRRGCFEHFSALHDDRSLDNESRVLPWSFRNQLPRREFHPPQIDRN